MLRIRAFKDSDLEDVDRIWRTHYANDFSLPNRNNLIIDAIIENDGKVIAYGQVRVFAEGMLVLDKNEGKRAKVEALKLLMLEAFRGTSVANLEGMYCFIKDPEFATLMSKQFSFEIVDSPGELLLRKV
jgi:hypothetical protein